MSSMIRMLLVRLKKGKNVFLGYNREHRHFKWFLGFNALLSFALVLGGFILVSERSSGIHAGQSVGSGWAAMSSTELFNHVKGSRTIAYWPGPISDDKYTHVDNFHPNLTITYWPKDSDINIGNQNTLIVETYVNSLSLLTPLGTYSDSAVARYVTTRGNTIEFNKRSMMEERVAIKDTAIIVVVHYPTKQSMSTMLENGKAVRPVFDLDARP